MSVYAFWKNPSRRIGAGMMPKIGEIFEKVTSPKFKSNFSGPARGPAFEKVGREKRIRAKMSYQFK